MLPSPDASMTSSTSGDSPILSDCRTISSPPHPRKPIPRKGHTKSRRGCYNCKRRRIKCSETRPECYHCDKAGLPCEYQVNIIQAVQPSSPSPSPQTLSNLQSTPGVFSMADMRLFHHFLTSAYPHLPVGADKIWVTVIPSFAHKYEYLMHSILALAASHLDAVSNSGVAEQAIQHRIFAVKSLNEALSTPALTQGERDARMAAALVLAFQSRHLQDGMSEFLLMIRGCNLIASDEAWEESASAFHPFPQYPHLLGTTRLQHLNPTDLTTASLSLHALHLLPMAPHEQSYYHTLLQTITTAHSNPASAYTNLTSLYNMPSAWAPATFSSFIAPGNGVARILLAHFIAVQVVLMPLLGVARVAFAGVQAPNQVLGWVEGVYWGIGEGWRGLVEWPRGVAGRGEKG